MSGESKKTGGIPAGILDQLNSADERHGFPKGTMASVMQQEVGGNSSKYLADPTTYHYPLDASGRRVAAHTGKVSSAFGPFGILESTGKDPGYGVQPLKGKDLSEQIRFASDYLAARSKSGGGLASGLAGYGEGAKYAGQVVGRLGVDQGSGAVVPPVQVAAPAVQVAEAPTQVSTGLVELPPELLAHRAGAVAPQAGPQADAWAQFLKAMPAGGQRAAVQPADLSYGMAPVAIQAPSMGRAPSAVTPNFTAFQAWGGKRA